MKYGKFSIVRTLLGPLAVFVGACCVGGAFQSDQGTMRRVTPMTMVVSEVADSGAIESQRMVAVRSDGARLAASLPSGRNHSPYDPRNLTIPKDGKRIVLWDRLGMMSTYYLDPETVANNGWVRVHPECLASVKPEARALGRETLLGLAAFRYGWDTRLSETGLQKDRVWVAPEADCQQLKFVSEIWRGEAMVNRFERTVISLT